MIRVTPLDDRDPWYLTVNASHVGLKRAHQPQPFMYTYTRLNLASEVPKNSSLTPVRRDGFTMNW